MAELRAGFDGVAELYDRIRPTYPPALFEELFARLPPQPDVVEIGPGTGQATGSLLAHGARVTAVELGTNMARRLGRNFEGREELHIVVSSFEDVALPSHSFDAVVAATAFHWIVAPANLEKPFELLRPGGLLAIIDTVQVAAPRDEGFFARAQPIYTTHGQGRDDPPLASPEQATSPFVTALAHSSFYDTPLLFRHRWDQTYATSAYGDLMRSYSGSQAMPEEEREALIAEMSQLIDREFGGRITRPLVITLTLARAVDHPRHSRR